jgi:tetratricopeptide (TPR) repeat protein
MIVKNEMAVLKENFDSIVDHLDYWVICDTGSTDGTQEFIKNYFKEKGIPGELHEEEWVNFGHNRSSYLKHAQGKSDYLIILDADFIVNIKDKDFKSKLTKENTAYYIKYEGNLDFRQVFLTPGNMLFKYVGVTHEYITSDERHDTLNFDGFTITHSGLGSNRSDKYERDIEMLTQGIKDEPNNARYYFYLANSYKNINKPEKALEYYLKRVEMGGWPEEVYYAMYEAGRCKQKMKSHFETTALPLYLKAFNYRKSRLEALYEIVKYYRLNGMWKEGYAYGLLGYENKYPTDVLFIDKGIHSWMFLDELAVCATNYGRHEFAIEIYDRLLKLDVLNNQNRKRIENNKNYSLKNSDLSKQKRFKHALEEMKDVLDKNNISFFLFCGTALGAYRENTFIQHDLDIDLGVLGDDILKVKNIKDSRFRIHRTHPSEENATEISFFSDKYNVSIDIFQVIETPKGLEHYSYLGLCNDKPNRRCTFINNFEFESIHFLGKQYLAPGTVFLDSHYGNDWQIVKKFNYWEGLEKAGTNEGYNSLQ